jgi:hypothetical protein
VVQALTAIFQIANIILLLAEVLQRNARVVQLVIEFPRDNMQRLSDHSTHAFDSLVRMEIITVAITL